MFASHTQNDRRLSKTNLNRSRSRTGAIPQFILETVPCALSTPREELQVTQRNAKELITDLFEGLVLHIGARYFCLHPIVEGRLIDAAVQHVPVGGDHVTQYFMQLVKEEIGPEYISRNLILLGFIFETLRDSELANRYREENCFLTDPQDDTRYEKDFLLPNGMHFSKITRELYD